MKLKEISTRRSTREFSDKVLEQEQLDNIIEAGLHAPTSLNMQAFKMVVVDRKEMTMELSIAAFGQPFVTSASQCIFIFALKNGALTEERMKETIKSWTPEEKLEEQARVNTIGFKQGAFKTDLAGAAYSIATTMAFEAEANGVGETIFSGFDKTAVGMIMQNSVDVNNYEPLVAIALGFAKDGYKPEQRKETSKDKVLKYKKVDMSQVM